MFLNVIRINIKSVPKINTILFMGSIFCLLLSTVTSATQTSHLALAKETTSKAIQLEDTQPYWHRHDFSFLNAPLNTTFSHSIADKVTDPEQRGMLFSISPNDGWLHVDASGNLYGIPQKTGVYVYKVTVTDGNLSFSHPDETTMTVIVSDTELTPMATRLGAKTALDDESSCLDGITNYSAKGPFSYTQRRVGLVSMWVPRVPAGCKVPVVHLANGTGATCLTYAGILSHLASHGFLATCYESTQTGYGHQCITAVASAFSTYPDMTSHHIGFTGHSQGGGAAFICTYRAEERWGNDMNIAGHAIEPASGFGAAPLNWASLYHKIHSPMFMFNGSLDVLVSSLYVRQAFTALNQHVEALWYQATGATHIPIPTRWSQESATAWFRWKLLGDQTACRYVKDMPQKLDWSRQDAQNEANCQSLSAR